MRAAIFGTSVGAFMHSMWNPAADSPSSSSSSSYSSSLSSQTDLVDSTSASSSSYWSEVAQCAGGVKTQWQQPQPGNLKPHPPAVDPKEFRPFPLVNVYDESPDTKVMRFAFPDGGMQTYMKLCSFIVLKYTDSEGNDVVRPYTPISRIDQRGYMEILVKCYKGSKMGTHLHRMKLGETIDAKGPYEKIQYRTGMYKKIGMIAGGSGITPMFQLAREVLKEAKPPELSLIYANRRKEDVLLGSELSELYEIHQNFAPYFVLDDPPRDWMGGVGHVTKDMIKALMPTPQRAMDSVILVCGPPGFMKHVSGEKDFNKSPPSQGELGGILRDLGYPQKMVYKF